MPQNGTIRSLLAVGASLAALTVAFVAGTGSAATATQGQPVIAGQYNTATSTTTVANSGAAGDGLNVFATTPGVRGIYASAPGIAVDGNGPTGVRGVSSGSGDGVDGQATNNCCSGVYGQNLGTGNGVAGRADTGTGVLAASTNGIGLKVDGKAQFSRSGVATVSAGQTYKQVSLTGLTSTTFVVATVQGSTGGVWVQRVAVTAASGYFRIYLNKAATVNTKVGWFAIN